MENILKTIGRFIGEKFALLETVYLKKADLKPYPHPVTNTINGYVEMLPPRPVKNDKYILSASSRELYEGIYFLNFGRNRREGRFYIIGDNQATAQGTNEWAEITAATPVTTGMIPIHPSAKLKIYTGVKKLNHRKQLVHTVQEYDASGTLIKTATCNIGGCQPAIYIPAATTHSVRLKITGEGHLLYIKLWENYGKPIDYSKIYTWNDSEWTTEKVPQNTAIAVKGKNFLLLNKYASFRQIPLIRIPKIPLVEGKIIATQSIALTNPVPNDDYIVKIFVKRKRLCKRKTGAWCFKNKYFEILAPRTQAPYFRSTWQQTKFVPSRQNIFSNPIYALPYTWNDIILNIFVPAANISPAANLTPGKLYPRTGLYCRDKHKKRSLTDFADLAICFSKKINKKWYDGEKTYFRIRQIRLNNTQEFTVRIL